MCRTKRINGKMKQQSFSYEKLSFSLQVIGIMAIEMIGAVYCPLSPRDPEERLHMLVTETKARVVLVHWLTDLKFGVIVPLLRIDNLLCIDQWKNDVGLEILSASSVSGESIAYTIFTSGSTGTPKAVS